MAQGGNIHMEMLVGENEVMTFVEYLTDESLKADLRYLSRRALLLLFESLFCIEEFAPSLFAKVAGTKELGRYITEYL